jgi:hypothetical protein
MNAIANAPIYDGSHVASLLGFRFDEALFALSVPPPIREGYVTFFDPGWSIVSLRFAVSGKRIFYPQDWYASEPFARLEEHPRYRQLRMEAVKGSVTKNFTEQQALVSADDDIPTARVVLMGTVIHFLATGDRLFPTCYVRCVDQLADRYRVHVGYFDSDGFDVYSYWDGDTGGVLGLASSRKF